MECQDQQQAFNEAMAKIQAALKDELAAIARQAQEKSTALNDEFKNANDLAQGVGAIAGTVIGGVIGGAPGAAIGTTVVEQIGSFFSIEIDSQEHKVSFDLPEITVTNQEWIFHLPSVTMKDTDIIFDLPTLVMRTVEGPPIWRVKVEMVTECNSIFGGKVCYDVPRVVGWWDKTYLDLPTWENRETRIVLGIPQITNQEQSIVIGIPEVAMRTKEMVFHLPTIRITLVKDAGKELADALKIIALAAQEDVAEKQMHMRERMKLELIGPANAMFDCFRETITTERARIAERYDTEIKKLTDAILVLQANNVPETDNDFIAQKAQLDAQIASRNLGVLQFDQALAAFDQMRQESIEKMIGMG